MIDQHAVDLLKQFMSDSKAQGAEVLLGAKEINLPYQGYYQSPIIETLEKSAVEKAQFLREEIFAPYVTIIPYEDLDWAIEQTNRTEYGLAASVFSSSDINYQKCVQEINVGILNFNRSTVGANAKLFPSNF